MNHNHHEQHYPQGYAPENQQQPQPQLQYPHLAAQQQQPQLEPVSSQVPSPLFNTTPAHSNYTLSGHPHYRMVQASHTEIAPQHNHNANAAPQIKLETPIARYQNQTSIQIGSSPPAFHCISTLNSYRQFGLASQQPTAHAFNNMTAVTSSSGSPQPQPRSYSSLALQIMEKQEASVRNGMMPASFNVPRTVSSLSRISTLTPDHFFSARSTPEPGFESPLELTSRNASFPVAAPSPLPSPFVNQFQTLVRVQDAPVDYTLKALISAEGNRNGVEVSQPQPLNLSQPSSVAAIFARPTFPQPDQRNSGAAMDMSTFEGNASAPSVVFTGPRKFNLETGFLPVSPLKRPQERAAAAPSPSAIQQSPVRSSTSTNSNNHLQQWTLEANFQQNVQDRQNTPQPLVACAGVKVDVGGVNPAQNHWNGNTPTNLQFSGVQQPSSSHQDQNLRVVNGNTQFNSPIQQNQNQTVRVSQVNGVNLRQVPFTSRAREDHHRQYVSNMDQSSNMENNQEMSEVQQPLQVTRAVISIPRVVGDFKGISYLMNEGGYADLLVDRLESNYMNSRIQVFNPKARGLMTPTNFLKKIGEEVETNMHSECFRFKTGDREVQFRVEVYFGRFCGVAHAETYTAAVQLAAAHVLERLRIYFRPEGLDSISYALYPGTRYTKVERKLVSLCNIYSLGSIAYNIQNVKWGKYFVQGPKYLCSCIVSNQQSLVRSDSTYYGNAEAAARLYKSLTSSADNPSLQKIQLKDYFAIGAECPTLNEIHARIFLHPPAENKLEWMRENQVSNPDLCLHDPTNASGYLDDKPVWKSADEPAQFKRKLEEALAKIKSMFQVNNQLPEGNYRDVMMNARSGLGRSVGGFGRHMPMHPVDEQIESSNAMEEGEIAAE